jgi:hypothetical protein
MIRRSFWFLAGAVTALWARRRVLQFADRFMPASVRAQASSRASALRRDLTGAVHDGRAAMRDRAAGLRGVPEGAGASGGSVPSPVRSPRPGPQPARSGRLPSVG